VISDAGVSERSLQCCTGISCGSNIYDQWTCRKDNKLVSQAILLSNPQNPLGEDAILNRSWYLHALEVITESKEKCYANQISLIITDILFTARFVPHLR
jgi:hypothetical protein